MRLFGAWLPLQEQRKEKAKDNAGSPQSIADLSSCRCWRQAGRQCRTRQIPSTLLRPSCVQHAREDCWLLLTASRAGVDSVTTEKMERSAVTVCVSASVVNRISPNFLERPGVASLATVRDIMVDILAPAAAAASTAHRDEKWKHHVVLLKANGHQHWVSDPLIKISSSLPTLMQVINVTCFSLFLWKPKSALRR